MSIEVAEKLIQVRRFVEAEKTLRGMLAQNPNHAQAHSLLALALLAQEKRDDALREAQAGVHAGPTSPRTHYTMGVVYQYLRRFDQAQRAMREAIRLSPTNGRYYRQLAEILLEQDQWKEALTAADEALKFSPNDANNLSVRAFALINLKQFKEAGAAADQALAADPENDHVQAAAGWARFNQMQFDKAFTHFGEALRMNPNLRQAKEGIVEAMKARNPIYRVMLSYFLWMSQMEPRTRWIILIGGYLAVQVAGRSLADTPLFLPFIILYVGFVFLSWTSSTLFDLTLRLDRFGRLALSHERIVASNWVGLCLLAGAGLAIAGLVGGEPLRPALLEAGAMMCALILPVSGIFHVGKSRRGLFIGYTLVLLALVVLSLLTAFQGNYPGDERLFFLLGVVGYTWFATFMKAAK